MFFRLDSGFRGHTLFWYTYHNIKYYVKVSNPKCGRVAIADDITVSRQIQWALAK